jgi:hypothetical protein
VVMRLRLKVLVRRWRLVSRLVVQCLDSRKLELELSIGSSWYLFARVHCRDLGFRDKGVSCSECLLHCC